MKTLSILSFLILLSCATKKNQSNPNMEKLSADVEVIVNNMPTTDSGSKNYAIITFAAGGDTLINDWKLNEFVLKNENNEIIQRKLSKELNSNFSGKGKTQMKINVRDLPKSIPSTIIVSFTLISDEKSEFYMESDPIQPMIVE